MTNDIYRDWKHVVGNAKELFWRNWQNDTLWYNDPDVIVLEKQNFTSRNANGEIVEKRSSLTDDEFEFHKAVIMACGGMILSGDLIPNLSEKNLNVLKKLLPPTGKAARFEDTTFTVGHIELGDRHVICLFNWEEQPKDMGAALEGSARVYDFWTDEEIGSYTDKLELRSMPPHAGRVLYYRK